MGLDSHPGTEGGEGEKVEGKKREGEGRKVGKEEGGKEGGHTIDHKAYLCHDNREKQTYQHQHTPSLLLYPLVHVSHGQHFLL